MTNLLLLLFFFLLHLYKGVNNPYCIVAELLQRFKWFNLFIYYDREPEFAPSDVSEIYTLHIHKRNTFTWSFLWRVCQACLLKIYRPQYKLSSAHEEKFLKQAKPEDPDGNLPFGDVPTAYSSESSQNYF